MHPKHAYRLSTVAGTATLTALSFAVANSPHVQSVVTTYLPLLGRLPVVSLSGTDRWVALGTVVVATLTVLLPLYKPQPRRILDTITGVLRSLTIAAFVVATVGYFDYTYRLPRLTLVVTVGILSVALPVWFVALQQWQLGRTGRTLIVGTSPERIETALEATAEPIAGYALSPTDSESEDGVRRINTDGGEITGSPTLSDHERLGGLSRLNDILRRANVETVVSALPRTDRAEFFGVLTTCHRHGVNVEILDGHDESVLLKDERSVTSGGDPRLVGIDLEPLDLQNRLYKRLFDVLFSGLGLLCALPLLLVIALLIRVDSGSPVFYAQERTAQFGESFSVYKFRTMRPGSESATPGEEVDRVTRVGRILRETHLDELPQLWSILRGRMSVVGPRPAWVAEEEVLRDEIGTWQKRWFVKPGLTGLAQINRQSSENSRAKLRYDIAYIKHQSFRFDLKILVRQLWLVFLDVLSLLCRRFRDGTGSEYYCDSAEHGHPAQPDTDEPERDAFDQSE